MWGSALCELRACSGLYLMPRCSRRWSGPAADHCPHGRHRWGLCHAHRWSPPRTAGTKGNREKYRMEKNVKKCCITTNCIINIHHTRGSAAILNQHGCYSVIATTQQVDRGLYMGQPFMIRFFIQIIYSASSTQIIFKLGWVWTLQSNPFRL